MDPVPASVQLRRWNESDSEKTLGGMIDALGSGGFSLLFVILMGVPALPLPTGGITHVLEVIAMLVSLQLIFGRNSVWIPGRWRDVSFEEGAGSKFVDGLMKSTAKLERFSKPRLRPVFGYWWSDVLYGIAVLAGAIAAFLAPPFTGLDTVPALGVVILSVGVMMEDFAYVVAGTVLIILAPILAITVGDVIYEWVKGLI